MVQKKYCIKTVNFGARGHPARVCAEKLCRELGNCKFSQLMRELVINYYSKLKSAQDLKIEIAKHKRTELISQIDRLCKRKHRIDDYIDKATGVRNDERREKD